MQCITDNLPSYPPDSHHCMECCFGLSATDTTSFITSCISRDSEMPLCYCHLMNNAGYITYFKTGLEMPPNCPFPWADLGSNLTHSSLGLHKSTHLDQFSHFSTAHSCDEQTHRQTTLHAATDCSLYFTQRCSSLLIPVVSAHLPLLTSYILHLRSFRAAAPTTWNFLP